MPFDTRNSSILTIFVSKRVAILLAVVLSAATSTLANGQDLFGDETAKQFIAETEALLDPLSHAATLAAWTASVDITDENGKQEVLAWNAFEAELLKHSKEARNYQTSDQEVARKLKLLVLNGDGLNANADSAKRRAELQQQMDNFYEQACATVDQGQPCLTHDIIEREIRLSREPDRLRRLWTAWYDTAAPQTARYQEYTTLLNEGAHDSGRRDAAEVSLAAYEVDPASFERELDALWAEVRPLYLLLHAYARDRLAKRYPGQVDPKGPIPIHLLGNLWGQEWEGIADILLPSQDQENSDDAFERAGLTSPVMVRKAEGFFESLGFPALPQTFHERSFFERPLGQDGKPKQNFACHATAWSVDRGDWRLRVCFEPTWADFLTAHHETGHIFYYQSFDNQPFLFRSAPNAGINEAVGDAVMLSVTPSYLEKIGLSEISPSTDEIGSLMRVALRKVARIPFGLMLQRWRWGVQSGRIPPERYNEAWWELVKEYQGLVPPARRPADAFDAAAKKHIAADIDYIRYFLADVLTFQIHEALSHKAGCSEPLYLCSIYGNQSAGGQLRDALSVGASRHWQDVLETMTGSRTIRGAPLRAYLAPLEEWLTTETRAMPIGW